MTMTTFRVTDERDLDIAATLGRYAGGRSTEPTATVRKMAKSDARRCGHEVYLWREQGTTVEFVEIVEIVKP